MANQVTWPTLYERNDTNLLARIQTNQPTAGTNLDLDGLTVEAIFKASAATPDNDAGAWVGSTATSGVTVLDAAAGRIEIEIPAAQVTTTKGWLRVDVLDGGQRKTGPYGSVTVVDL